MLLLIGSCENTPFSYIRIYFIKIMKNVKNVCEFFVSQYILHVDYLLSTITSKKGHKYF